MENAAPAKDLERRKQLRVRLRRDLAIEAQRYEGRTLHVVKDPVNLRYYRLNATEHFLLPFLDVNRPLEEQEVALRQSSRLNDAYRTLRDPVQRTQHLLALEGVEMEEQSKAATDAAQSTPPTLPATASAPTPPVTVHAPPHPPAPPSVGDGSRCMCCARGC